MAFSDRQNTFKRSAPERVLGIIGYPLEHTLSPAMHNAAFAVSGLDWVYAAFRVPPGSASAAVEAVRVLGLGGLSVTIPHKEEVLSALDVLEPEAQAIGAVNTVFWTPDRDQLVGANTDVEGFEKGLKTALGINLEGRSVVIIGAGGSARAVLWAAVTRGARHITVLARTPSRASRMVRRICESAFAMLPSRTPPPIEICSMDGSLIEEALSNADLMVNATPLGSDGTSLPVPESAIHDRLYVFDLVYFPSKTPLVQAGIRRGAGAAGGLEMLILQGARQFEIWTGRPAPVSAMKRAAEESLRASLQIRTSTAEIDRLE